MKTTDVEFDTFNKTETMQTVQEYIDTLESRLALAVEALEFYGFKAIHNPLGTKTEQYWNDEGIWDHGEKAREALAKIRGEK